MFLSLRLSVRQATTGSTSVRAVAPSVATSALEAGGTKKKVEWWNLPESDVLRFDPVKRFSLQPDLETSTRALTALRQMYRGEFTGGEREKLRRKIEAFEEENASGVSATAAYHFFEAVRGSLRRRHADEAVRLLLECWHVGNLIEKLSDRELPESSGDLTVVPRLVTVQPRQRRRPVEIEIPEFTVEMIDSELYVVASEVDKSSEASLRASFAVCGEVADVVVAGDFAIIKYTVAESASKATSLSARLFGVLVSDGRKNQMVFPLVPNTLTVLRVTGIPWRAQTADVVENFSRTFRGEAKVESVSLSRGLLPDHAGTMDFKFATFSHVWAAYRHAVTHGLLVNDKSLIPTLERFPY